MGLPVGWVVFLFDFKVLGDREQEPTVLAELRFCPGGPLVVSRIHRKKTFVRASISQKVVIRLSCQLLSALGKTWRSQP